MSLWESTDARFQKPISQSDKLDLVEMQTLREVPLARPKVQHRLASKAALTVKLEIAISDHSRSKGVICDKLLSMPYSFQCALSYL